MNDLFIGGAGYGGPVFVGALEYLHKNKLLDLKNSYGTSIGSLIVTAYSLGITPLQMLEFMINHDFSSIMYDLNNIQNKHILGDKVLDDIINIINIKEDNSNLTLSGFKTKTDININIYATDVTNRCYKCFNNNTDGDVKLVDCLKASMSIPFLFKPVSINNNLYVDGACTNLFGAPPRETYILGYSFIIKQPEPGYFIDLLNACLATYKPRSTFLLEFNHIKGAEIYFNLNSLDETLITRMFKYGIENCKKCIT